MTEQALQKRTAVTWKLLLLCGSLVLSMLLVEVALRLAWTNPFVAERPALLVHIATQPPGTNRTYLGPYGKKQIRFRTDANGYIEPSSSGVKGATRVAFFGGSTTECSAVSEALRYPALAAKLLKDRGLPIDALNAGRSGNTTHESLNVLLNHTLAHRPDVAVMMHAVNDTGVLAIQGGYQHAMAHRDGLKWGAAALARRLAGASYIVGLLRFINLGGAKHTTGPRTYDERRQRAEGAPFERRLRSFIHIARDFGITPVLMTQPMAHERDKNAVGWAQPAKQTQFNDLIRAVGLSEAVSVIDVDAKVRAIPGWDKPNRYFYDGLHVNDRGSEVVAKIVADGLQPVIEAIRGD